nr:NAD(P)-dependent oxidoreductase [Bacillus licheniformis]
MTDHHIHFTELDQLLKECDFITLHMPLTAETENMIGEKELAAMKETAYLINASRGGIVSECALYDALASGGIAGAALDVYQTEPLKRSTLSLSWTVLSPCRISRGIPEMPYRTLA